MNDNFDLQINFVNIFPFTLRAGKHCFATMYFLMSCKYFFLFIYFFYFFLFFFSFLFFSFFCCLKWLFANWTQKRTQINSYWRWVSDCAIVSFLIVHIKCTCLLVFPFSRVWLLPNSWRLQSLASYIGISC